MRPREHRRFLARNDQGLSGVVWVLLFSTFMTWIAYRLGAFDIWATVTSSDGSIVRIPNTFASVDHPFHASRAETLRRSLAGGDLLRWIGNHQGGYPAEFYPLGAAWLEVLAWGMALGTLPMMVIHKVVVIGVFLLPVVGFAALARADKLPWSVPFLALAVQVSVRGWWWSGGYMELIEWGLLTNVASAAVLPVVIAAHRSYLVGGGRNYLVLAAAVAAFAMYTNVRSIFPLAAIVVGVAMSCMIGTPGLRARLRAALVRSLGAIGLTLLVLAPLAIALLRFSDRYVFVRYSGYDSLGAYWDSTVQAISSPVLVFAVLGSVFAVVKRHDEVARTVLVVLAIYMLGTLAAGSSTLFGDLVTQLEATRLMPFQRLLMIYLAAYGAYSLIAWAAQKLRSAVPAVRELAMIALSVVVVSAYLLSWIPGVSDSDKATARIVTTADASIVDLEASISLADREAPSGTTILVLGGVISWHDQLWAPQWGDRWFFYDDWLWYWQTDHVGDYDPRLSHAYDRDASTLTSEYLGQHAIGAVVVTGDASSAAAGSQLLTRIRSGIYDTYLVVDAQPMISAARIPVGDQLLNNEAISGVADSPATEFLVRHNWYPRWSASIDGQRADITKDSAGYMVITGDDPGSRLQLSYRVDTWDWFARVLWVAGLFVSIALVAGSKVGRAGHRFRPRWHAERANREAE